MTTKTVPLLMLNNELNRLKQESGVKDQEVADYLGCRGTKINRILNMTSRPSVGDVRMMGEAYGASPELISVMMDLARNLGKKGDWTGYKAVYREAARMLIDLEAHCDRIREMRAEIIPGLLQTQNYVRALTRLPSPFSDSFDEDEIVKARRDRQALLEREVNLSFVLSESALRRVYGDHAVMREQMNRLVDVANMPNVLVQVLPLASANQTSYGWLSFAMIHVPGPGIAAPLNLVHLEQYDDERYIDDPTLVEGYERLWGFLQAAALGPVESVDFIGEVAEEYS
ncbi:helix-turn-helix domain-containing protein [Actinosynnema sp. ALI-1.44]|uniref:helix-turn-helix domain-containing protein n=1 Tax=Actinosynnema sp. ALI-1.44 TaxID=1933779 RepID=UPI000A076535|nr:helix-turn-helix transcriptional regulator [Actinosynnema sp. ALI-1.44]